MKNLKAKYIMFMHNHFKRYRLQKICEALDIVPYPWQRDFALGKSDKIDGPMVYRCSGKTMAVMLRLLMLRPNEPHDVLRTLKKDPDFTNDRIMLMNIYQDEYNNLAHKCRSAGIPVNSLALNRLYKVI
jgi:hypothetical protein